MRINQKLIHKRTEKQEKSKKERKNNPQKQRRGTKRGDQTKIMGTKTSNAI